MNRRTLVKLVIGGATASVLAACGVNSQPSAPQPTPKPAGGADPGRAANPAPQAAAQPTVAVQSTQPASAPAAAPKAGGVLKQAYLGDPTSLDPMLKVGNDAMWIGVFERLTAYDDKLKPQPMLAESWEISSDAKQVKVNLRKGVQFHSGREMTSDDVKYSLQRAANPKVAAGTVHRHGSLVLRRRHARQVHRHLQVGHAAADDLRPARVPAHLRQGHARRPGRQEHRRRHRPVQVCRVGAGRSHHTGQEPELLAVGQAVPRRHRDPIFRDQQAMATQLEAGAIDIALRPSLVDFNRLKTDSEIPGDASND